MFFLVLSHGITLNRCNQKNLYQLKFFLVVLETHKDSNYYTVLPDITIHYCIDQNMENIAPFTPFPPSFRIPGPPPAAHWSPPGFLPGPPKSGQHRGGQQAGSQGPSLDSWGPRYQQQHSKVSEIVVEVICQYHSVTPQSVKSCEVQYSEVATDWWGRSK